MTEETIRRATVVPLNDEFAAAVRQYGTAIERLSLAWVRAMPEPEQKAIDAALTAGNQVGVTFQFLFAAPGRDPTLMMTIVDPTGDVHIVAEIGDFLSAPTGGVFQ